MADVDPGDILRLGTGLILGGLHDIVNVWHVEVDQPAGIAWAAAITLITNWAETVYDELKATLTDECSTGSISVANVTQETTLGSIPWSPTWSGGDTSDITPAGACAFAWGRTYKPRVQMRKYFGVFGEGNLTTGSWSAAVQAAVAAAMAVARAKTLLAADTYFQAVAYNRALGTFETVYSVGVRAEPAYQRRRKRGVGS